MVEYLKILILMDSNVEKKEIQKIIKHSEKFDVLII